MDVPPAVYAIWGVLLVAAIAVVLPVVAYWLHRLLRAARSIERYTAEALAAGLGIARHAGAIGALDETGALGGELGPAADSIRRHGAAIEKTLADRA